MSEKPSQLFLSMFCDAITKSREQERVSVQSDEAKTHANTRAHAKTHAKTHKKRLMQETVIRHLDDDIKL